VQELKDSEMLKRYGRRRCMQEEEIWKGERYERGRGMEEEQGVRGRVRVVGRERKSFGEYFYIAPRLGTISEEYSLVEANRRRVGEGDEMWKRKRKTYRRDSYEHSA
jgi:hypothetical protein